MIQRFIAGIDALGDRVHPIVVLMLRKQGFWKGMVPLTVGTHILLLFIVMGGEQLTRSFGQGVNYEIVGMLLWVFSCFPCFASYGMVVNGYRFVQKSDPLLLSTPLSDRSVWLGFYLAGLYQGFGMWCYVVLIYSYCHALRWVPLEYVLLYPLLSLLAGYVVTALITSMYAAARTVAHHCFLFPIWFLPMWCFLVVFMQPSWIRSRILVFLIPTPLFEPICWVPVLVLAVPAYLWAAWKLFHFNLPRRRPFVVKYGVSLLVYLTLTACFVGLWFGLRFLFIGV